MYKSRNKIISKFVEKLLKYRIMFKDIFTFLGNNYREASLIISYFVKKNQYSDQMNWLVISHEKILPKKFKVLNGFSSND